MPTPLADLGVDNIPPAPAGVPKVLVQFFVDTNGILNVKATNKATGDSKKIRITHSKGRFTDDQMEKMARRAEKYAERDKKERERVEKLLELKKYVRDIQKQLKTKVGHCPFDYFSFPNKSAERTSLIIFRYLKSAFRLPLPDVVNHMIPDLDRRRH